MTAVKRIDVRTQLLFAAVAVGLVAFGIVVMVGFRVDADRATMAVYYLSMACQCPWHYLPKALQFFEPGHPWSIHMVPGPYRYRVLVPWVIGHLPGDADMSLRWTTYVTLAISYGMLLMACRRLGLSVRASIFGLLLAYAFEPNLDAFFNPYRLDGFGLMVIAIMLYAVVVESFWAFAIAGLVGVFARESTLVLLPVWGIRDVKRGVALTVAGSIAWIVWRAVLYGPPETVDPMTIFSGRLHNPNNVAKDLLSTWSWAFAVIAIGIGLFRDHSFRSVSAMSLGLLAVAAVSYLLASDIMRLFLVLMPVVAMAGARLIELLTEKRQRLLLIALFALIVLQFSVSRATRLSPDPLAIAAMVRPLRVGLVWAAAAAFVLRRELGEGVLPRKQLALPSL